MFSRKILLNLEATPSCPAACAMCPRSAIKDEGFMSVDLMRSIMDQVDPSFVREIDLGGRGEPTIHPKLPELLDAMKGPGVPTCVVTTGVTFTQKNIDACAKNVDRIRLSVSSAHKPTFDKVHIGLKHEQIWRNIEALGRAAADKVVVHLVGGPVIYDHLPETVERLREFGYRDMHLFPLWNRGGAFVTQLDNARRRKLMAELGLRAAESDYSSGTGKVKHFLNIALGKLQNKDYCPVGDGSISISYKGDILGCFQDFGHTSNVGRVGVNDLRRLLEERVRYLGKMKICEECDCNKVALFSLNTKIPMTAIIAITASVREAAVNFSSGQAVTFVNDELVGLVASLGCAPLIVPVLADEGAARAVVGRVDGLLLSAGQDIDPASYGAACGVEYADDVRGPGVPFRRPRVIAPSPARDRSEIALYREARRKGIPVFGLCRGMQIMNVAEGGTLRQEILPGSGVSHNVDPDGWINYHAVAFEPGTLSAEIVGQGSYFMPSVHHQAIDRLGGGLRASARAEDGVVEMIEHVGSGQFVVGVQGHVEKSRVNLPAYDRLWREFARRAGGRP